MKLSGTINKLMGLMVLLVLSFSAYSCGAGEPADSSALPGAVSGPAQGAGENAGEVSSSEAVVDLSVPPPGSQATQEKWDGFDEEKRQASWDKYLEGLAGDLPADSPAAAGTDNPAGAAEVPAAPVDGKAVAVVVAGLTQEPMEIYYYGLAEVEAGKTYRVNPLVAGTAVRVYVNEGDFVEPGDLLFALDSSEWVKDIERTEEKWEAEVTLARIRLDEAEKNLQSIQAFFDRDLVTRQDLDKAIQTATETRLNLDKVQLSRKNELEALQENYKARLGVSPGRGFVSVLSFTQGEVINSTDFVEVVNLEEVELSIDVPENVVPRIKRGAPVMAKAASAARYGLEGVVLGHSILPDENRSYRVRAALDNPNQRLLPGMLMEVQIQVSQVQPRFVVPRQAVVTDGTAHFLFFAKEGQAVKVPVDLGAGRQGLVQVDGDMTDGDLLVIEGQSYLRAGSPVTVKETRGYLPDRIEL